MVGRFAGILCVLDRQTLTMVAGVAPLSFPVISDTVPQAVSLVKSPWSYVFQAGEQLILLHSTDVSVSVQIKDSVPYLFSSIRHFKMLMKKPKWLLCAPLPQWLCCRCCGLSDSAPHLPLGRITLTHGLGAQVHVTLLNTHFHVRRHSVRQQQNVMEYLVGRFSLYCHPTTTQLWYRGQHHKIGGITFRAALISIH